MRFFSLIMALGCSKKDSTIESLKAKEGHSASARAWFAVTRN
jgi:hypothetical protein